MGGGRGGGRGEKGGGPALLGGGLNAPGPGEPSACGSVVRF